MTGPGTPKNPTAFLESWNTEEERLATHGPASMIDRYYALVHAPVDVLLHGDDDLYLVIQGEQSGNSATERIPVFLIQVIRQQGTSDKDVLARVRLRRPSNVDIQSVKIDFSDVEKAFGTQPESSDLWAALEGFNAVPAGLRENQLVATIDPASVPPLDDKDRTPALICRVDVQIGAGFSVGLCTIIGCWPNTE